ncbi:MAG: Uncharacterized protein FD123_2404 [Bacteroidetes bacterium]|nr:MAG: Uncharacterized protein FD123_2404 [Bacteroidota bacterium]
MKLLPGSAITGTLVKLGLIGGGVFLLWRWFKKNQDERRASRSDKDITTNPGVGQAQLLRIAMNPSGVALLFDNDGTNKDAIFKVASQIKDLDAVVEAYKDRYSGSLLKHLEVELGPADYARFLALSGGGNSTGNNYEVIKQGVKPMQWMRATKPAFVRSAPKKENGLFSTEGFLINSLNPLTFFDKYKQKGNIITQAQPQEVVGWTTGKTSYDEKNDIIFLEGLTLNKKRQRVSFWIAKSQVEFITPEDLKARRSRGEKFRMTELKGLPSPTTIYAIKQTDILDESFCKVATVSPGTVLGQPLIILHLVNEKFIQFQNQQGLIRWTVLNAVRQNTNS